jgi:hypothetical protein
MATRLKLRTTAPAAVRPNSERNAYATQPGRLAPARGPLACSSSETLEPGLQSGAITAPPPHGTMTGFPYSGLRPETPDTIRGDHRSAAAERRSIHSLLKHALENPRIESEGDHRFAHAKRWPAHSLLKHSLEEFDLLGEIGIVLHHLFDLADRVKDGGVIATAETPPDFGERTAGQGLG